MNVNDKPHETGIRATAGFIGASVVPLLLVTFYRLIPDHARGVMFPGPSTSLKAVRDIRNGENGWVTIRRYARVVW